MRPNQLKRTLKKIEKMPENPSILLLGKAGIGKSTAVREVAKEIAQRRDKEFIEYDDAKSSEILSSPEEYYVFVDLRLTECEPSDLIGLPRETNGSVVFKPLRWAEVLSKTSGVLFLDELTNVQRPDILSVAYKLVFDRMAGFTKFDDDVLLISAGNKPKHSSVAVELPAPLMDRVTLLPISTPTLREWEEWMTSHYGEDWDRTVLGFLQAFKEENYFARMPDKPETLKNYPTPRSWTKVARYLARGIDGRDVIDGTVGKEVGQRFRAFRKTEVDIERLMREPERFRDLEIDGRYMTCLRLASWISEAVSSLDIELKRSFSLIDQMSQASSEYIVLTSLTIKKKETLISFLKELFDYKEYYYEELKDIVELKNATERV